MRDDARESAAAAEGGTDEVARREEEVLGALSGVCEQCSGKQVVQMGFVQDLLVKGKAGLSVSCSITSSLHAIFWPKCYLLL